MTFSIVARCAETGMFGMAIASSSPAVAARCAHARAGVGVVASQNVTDPGLGPHGLDLLAKGYAAPQALSMIRDQERFMAYRQLMIVDVAGRTAIHSGPNALGIWAEAQTDNAASGDNLLINDRVPQAMLDGFSSVAGHLGDRLIAALQAGLDAGGEAGPVHSAGLVVVHSLSWPLVDLRCDWTTGCPIDAVAAAWSVYKPQMADYVQRALDPSAAPSYGVPGDA